MLLLPQLLRSGRRGRRSSSSSCRKRGLGRRGLGLGLGLDLGRRRLLGVPPALELLIPSFALRLLLLLVKLHALLAEAETEREVGRSGGGGLLSKAGTFRSRPRISPLVAVRSADCAFAVQGRHREGDTREREQSENKINYKLVQATQASLYI